jgi:hypothetical protein
MPDVAYAPDLYVVTLELCEMAKSGGAVCHVSLRDVDNQSTQAFVR